MTIVLRDVSWRIYSGPLFVFRKNSEFTFINLSETTCDRVDFRKLEPILKITVYNNHIIALEG